MEQSMNDERKKTTFSDVFIFPFVTFYNILVYAFIGFKAVFYDVWIKIFNKNAVMPMASLNLSTGSEMEDENAIYERTKKKVKKEKAYKYSPKMLAQLEKDKQELHVDLQNAGATRSKDAHVYQFKVKDKNGKIFTGTMNGLSKLDVNAYLLNEGYEVFSIKNTKWIDFVYQDSSLFGSKKMSTKDLIFWLTQLSTYVKAGITLNEAIKILNNQMKGSVARRRAFEAISYELVLGESFSRAMEKQGSMFPALLINMIKAAEASGTLTETLDDMADYYTEIDATRRQMISAMTYPGIITVFAIAVVTFILIFVVPQFTEIYATNGSEISGITRMVINVSDYLKFNYLKLIGMIALVILTIVVLYKSVRAFRTSFQILLMHIPIVKDVIIYNELTIFAKTFASLLKNNVFITDSMGILSKITNNEIYRAILYRTINNVVKGEKISEAFKDHWAVPDVAYYMIVTGESTGDLATMMQKVSEYYQRLHKNIINNLKSFIEPVMISFLALIVGTIIIAVIVPMFGIYDTIN